MKVITSGHKYELENFEAKDQPGQIIQFIEKKPVFDCEPGQDPKPSGVLTTVNDGTTNEEVLRVLIDRMESLYKKFPSDETVVAIWHLKSALYAQQSRTFERQKRGVEGKALA